MGEIWIAWPDVGNGYWNRPDASTETFEAELDGERYLRTGDVGASFDDQLCVTGRLKDLLIINGRNLYPQHIEQTVMLADPRTRRGCVAAFEVDARGRNAAVVVAEVIGFDIASTAAAELRVALRGVVTGEHGIAVRDVMLIDKDDLPKTSSGKLQRQATRAAYLDGMFG